MKVKIKRLSDKAVIPQYAHDGDAGMDLTATRKWVDDNGNMCYGTDLTIEIPYGYVGFIFPRSSISKTRMNLRNAVGVIDFGYTGEITFKFSNELEMGYDYDVNDRVGQLIIMERPHIEFIEVDELSTTERGSGGFGSTGK